MTAGATLIFTQHPVAIFIHPVKTLLRFFQKLCAVNDAIIILVGVILLPPFFAPRLMIGFHLILRDRTDTPDAESGDDLQILAANGAK